MGRSFTWARLAWQIIETNQEMKAFSLFSIASMTKPVTATAVMILQDEGKLSVDDKVSKYIPAFAQVKLKDGESPVREITIRDAITHTSGLSGDQVFQGSLEDAVNEIARRPLAFEPGSKWQYSPGLNVAGRIVEIVSKQPLQDFVKERIFDPLEMKNTTFFPDQKQQRLIAQIYEPSEDKQSLVAVDNRITNPSDVLAPNPSGGLFSSARDMFRFYQMILNGGQFRGTRVVSKEAVQANDIAADRGPGNRFYARQLLGIGMVYRARAARRHRHAGSPARSGTAGHSGRKVGSIQSRRPSTCS